MARIRLPFKFKVKNNSIISTGALTCWALGIMAIVWGLAMISQINPEFISDLIIMVAIVAIGLSLIVVGIILQIQRLKDIKKERKKSV